MKPVRLLAFLFSFLLLISLVCACTVTPDEESSLESSSETSSFHQVENEEIASQFQDLPYIRFFHCLLFLRQIHSRLLQKP